MDLGILLLAVLATARLTRLVTEDKITERPRRYLAKGAPGVLSYFIHCPWCVSIYTGSAVAVSWWLWGGAAWHTASMLALAASHITGELASRAED